MNGFTSHPASMLVLYCVLVLLASLLGGGIPLFIRLTHARLQLAVSLVAGLMLGMALLHLLPDAAEQLHSLEQAMGWGLGGFLAIFFIQRFFFFHHHDLPDEEPASGDHPDHDHASEAHTPHGGGGHTLAEESGRQLSWIGTALGLTLHSLLGGLALAAGVEAGAASHHRLVGLGIALVIILHKPFDAMAITTLMSASGSSRSLRHLLNALFALVTPLGVVLFYFGARQFAQENQLFLGCSLAFVAGSFLCIAGSDLLPELQFHSHDRFKLSLALLLGLGIAILIGHLEGSDHEHARIESLPTQPAQAAVQSSSATSPIARLSQLPAAAHARYG